VLDPQELRTDSDPAWVGQRDLVFYAEDLESGERYAYRGQSREQRHTPWSTFKIANLLIALETGVAPDLDYRIAYDPVRRPAQSYWPQDWKQDQTLESAFRRSAAWYYQDLALLIGSETYRGYLGHFGYGNVEVGQGSDQFWLDATLQISPREQVSFLRRLLLGQLEISPRNIALLGRASKIWADSGFELHGKTGAGPRRSGDFDGPFEGWLVGWLQRPAGQPVVFATWVSAPSFAELKDFRQQASERLLRRMGVMPDGPES
jgi:beta-lactamase class D